MEPVVSQSLNAFWAEMSACEHFVQIYETDTVFIETLTSFVSDGLDCGEAVVVIATPAHRREIIRRLLSVGLDVAGFIVDDRLVLLDADETIDKFMKSGWPDEELFASVIAGILERAARGSRKVRAFGEMVAVLWARGFCEATVRLEHLWHRVSQKETFPIFCAYPKPGFTRDPAESIGRICQAHSKVLSL